MIRKKSIELAFVRSRSPLPTVEVNRDILDSRVPEITSHEVAQAALARYAAEHPDVTATIYTYETMSVNFHERCWSEFLIVAGTEPVLQSLYRAYEALNNVPVKYSDQISPSNASIGYHLQDGRIWEIEEQGVWFSKSVEEIESDAAELKRLRFEREQTAWLESARSEAALSVSDEKRSTPYAEFSEEVILDTDSTTHESADDFSEDEHEQEGQRTSHARRFRSARSDATIGSIRSTIEKLFGLPEGSVQLCGPDKVPLRSDARVRTLRRRWNYDLSDHN